jgi:hypothetical protein
MTTHPSLIPATPETEKEKTLRDELREVAENAVREYVTKKAKTVKEAQEDPDILSKLDEISRKLDEKNSNLKVEKTALNALLKELGYPEEP